MWTWRFSIGKAGACLLALLCVSGIVINAQPVSVTDSLKRVVAAEKHDTSEVIALYTLSRYIKWSDTEAAFTYAQQALKLAHQLDYNSGRIYSYNAMGIVLQDQGAFRSALLYLDTALQLARAERDSFGIGMITNNCGLIHLEQGNFETALGYLLDAAAIREKTGDERGEAGSYNNIGLLYSYMGQPADAIPYYKRSLEIKERIGDRQGVANTYLNIGLAYDGLKDTARERSNYRNALEIYLTLNDKKGQSMVYNNFGEAYAAEGRYEQALDYHGKAYTLRKEMEDVIGQAQTGTNIANCLIALGRTAEAETYINESIALATQEDSKKELALAYAALSNLHVARRNFEPALEAYKMSAALMDSILNEESISHLQEMQAKYESEKKEREILELQAEAERATYKRNIVFIGLLAGVIILLVVAAFIFLRYRARQQRLRELAVLETKQNERIRIARDMHDDIGSGLTRISLLSQQVISEFNKKDADSDLTKTISSLGKLTAESRQLTGNMGEIIWTMSPKNDTLDGLTSYIRNYAHDFLEQAGMDCIVQYPDEIPELPVTAEFRRNIFLCVKETLNNVVKHSGATTVHLELVLNRGNCTITIRDNGRGASLKTKGGGNGLLNMKKRIEETGGRFRFEHREGQGAVTVFENIPLENTTKV